MLFHLPSAGKQQASVQRELKTKKKKLPVRAEGTAPCISGTCWYPQSTALEEVRVSVSSSSATTKTLEVWSHLMEQQEPITCKTRTSLKANQRCIGEETSMVVLRANQVQIHLEEVKSSRHIMFSY